MIPVQFNPANYSVKEGVDSSAVIFLELLGDHSGFNVTIIVNTQDGTAIGESCRHSYINTYTACWDVWCRMLADYLKATAVNPLIQLLSGQSTMMSNVFKPYNYYSGMKNACMVLCSLFQTHNCKQMALTLLVDVSQLPSQLE